MLERSRYNTLMNRLSSDRRVARRGGPGRRQRHQRHSPHDGRLEADDPQAPGRSRDGVRPLLRDRTLRNLASRRIQCDEIWQFCYAQAEDRADREETPPTWLATCGHGSRLTRTRSSSHRGSWQAATSARPTRSCTTWPTG